MADPRIQVVADTLRENGVANSHDDLDTLATKVVNALDREFGLSDEPDPETAPTLAPAADAASTPPANPETPAGTGTEGGTPAGQQ